MDAACKYQDVITKVLARDAGSTGEPPGSQSTSRLFVNKQGHPSIAADPAKGDPADLQQVQQP